MTTPLLELDNISVSYAGVSALQAVSLTVQQGEIVTVIGPNGAGKTTLLNAIMGFLPFAGRAHFAGVSIARSSVEARVKSGLGLVTEERDLFGSMTVEDNLVLGAFHRRAEPRARLDENLREVFDLFPRLKERRIQLAHTLSGGERQMLAVGRALLCAPRLLMLDEPSLGLAPLIVRDIFRIVGRLRERGVSVLLVEQNARAALKAADRAYVLETGKVVLHGSAQSLEKDKKVTESYLGIGKVSAPGPAVSAG
jgi:branched-chain amino acid transport system ATP-binding protein